MLGDEGDTAEEPNRLLTISRCLGVSAVLGFTYTPPMPPPSSETCALNKPFQFRASSITKLPFCMAGEASASRVGFPASRLCGFSKYELPQCAIVKQWTIGLLEVFVL